MGFLKLDKIILKAVRLNLIKILEVQAARGGAQSALGASSSYAADNYLSLF